MPTGNLINSSISIPNITSSWIKSIRGFGSLYIFIGHLLSVFIYPLLGAGSGLDNFLFSTGSYLLMLFFIVSGYVITFSIYKNIEKNRYFCAKSYLSRRLARVYPPLTLALIISALVVPIAQLLSNDPSLSLRLEGDLFVVRSHLTLDFNEYLTNFFLLHRVVEQWPTINNNGPLWTLSIEFWIYMLAMTAASWLINKRLALGLIPTIAAIFFLVCNRNVMFLNLLFIFLLGVTCAIFQIKKLFVPTKFYLITSVLLISYAIISVVSNPDIVIPYSSANARLFQYALLVLGLIWFINFHHRSAQFLSPFIPIGSFSLSLYIFHFPIFLLFFYILHPNYHEATLSLKLVTTAAVGLLSFFLIRLLAGLVESYSPLYKWLTTRNTHNNH
jgi:peptidoglycan/LPS O-acetylase OafA/YrhL